MKRILTLALIIAFAAPLAGCQNTADGFGRDLEKAGQNIQKKV
jgi:predicted small secreted protein